MIWPERKFQGTGAPILNRLSVNELWHSLNCSPVLSRLQTGAPCLANFARRTLVLLLVLIPLTRALATGDPMQNLDDEFGTRIRPLVDQYCAKCHGTLRAK